MERIPYRSAGLFTIFLLIIGVSRVYGITVTARDETGIKGPNPVAVKCEYVLAPGEVLFSITMSRKRTTDPSYTDIAVFRPDVNSALYGASVAEDFKLRTTLIMSDGSTSVRFDSVECEDEAAYRCTVSYQTAGTTAATQTADMNLLLQAQPLTPTITLTPAHADGYTDGEQVHFQCQGSVGKPAGDFLWFRYRGNTPEDITSLAILNPAYSSPGTCTSDRISQLKLNVSRQDNGMTIRCAANHTLLTKPTGFETCNSTCRQTDKITVFYTFTDSDPDVSSNPAGGTHTVGDTVTLKCNADTNPPATFSWHKEGDDNSTTPGEEWTLSNLQIEDSGTYTCMATNVVGGVTYNASRSLNINVVATTTTPSTTPSTSTQSPPSGKTDAVKPGPTDDGDNTTIIIVVCVVVGLVLILGIIAGVCFYRRRKAKSPPEEPSEKPYNNQNMSIYSTKPDLVTNDNKKFNHYNNKNEDALNYADLQFDTKPRSRKPVALADTMTDYADVSMPQV
ncbi:cell adhesion molecule 2-like [Haliotis rufescens]|uniref:cell adhesion molecule 2-like n=1 Tax=Haliotis rufescens TaxID=6454 RepID=UPI00201F656D|nr:cell adhesion molecule 2-like [Haliotis rufescens]XP_046335982.2 cell adhesion molecule 2-like [Haliotis rufescens]